MLIRNVGELVRGKKLFSTTEETSVYEMCLALRRHNIGALAVLRDRALVGIVSERDVITRVVSQNRDPAETRVGEVMTRDPQTIEVGSALTDALAKMLAGHFRHLPVLEDGMATGMMSMRDIPMEYQYMYQRFQRAITTPAAEAEAELELDQHQHGPMAADAPIPAGLARSAGWSFLTQAGPRVS